ncbi:hypothetical protein BDY24DRAFT_118424 [Mrakia frigida]|uniref:Bsd2p n=1 Tax=Mrakia frigida TaxID=29902 RepID=UPI003FCC2006
MAPAYSNLPSSPTTSSSRSSSYPPPRPSSSFGTAASSSLPRRQPNSSSSHEMDAAFDDSDSDEDENVPLSRIPAAAARGAGGAGRGTSAGGGGTVVWSVDENGEEEQDEQIKQPTPVRSGAVEDPLRSSTAGGGGEGDLIGRVDADEGGGGAYDFDRDYVSFQTSFSLENGSGMYAFKEEGFLRGKQRQGRRRMSFDPSGCVVPLLLVLPSFVSLPLSIPSLIISSLSRLSQFLPPPGSPPPGAYPEAYLPSGPTPLTTTPAYPRAPSASTRFIRSILPTHFTRSAAPPITRGSDGVFANIMAKPEVERPGGEGNGNGEGAGSDGENGTVMAEYTQKEGPPSYNVALRDAVPAYWEHNVVAPQNGPLGSFSGSGDDLLLDGLPIGNFFGFAWNLLVSLSFQFVGFLLTYVLHTTHAAKYGSRAGLGITLIQYGLYLRTRADEILASGSLDPDVGTNDAFGAGGWWGVSDENGVPSGGLATTTTTVAATPTATTSAALAIPTFSSMAEADAWATAHNTTIWEAMGQPNAQEVGEANEWMSFVLMSCGWFILLTSLGGYWRVKRFGSSPFLPRSSVSSLLLN